MKIEGWESIALNLTLQKLRMTEQKVKAHELAHKIAGGELAGPVKYKYKRGPDGKLYIVGGEVPLRLKKGKTPEETIEIARKVKRAALAPLDPSPQDRAVAMKATAMEMQARLEMMLKEKDQGQNPKREENDQKSISIFA